MIKLVSWNVNGLRACVGKGFNEYFKESAADIFCVQETKLQAGQITLDQGEEYYQFWNYAQKKDTREQRFLPESSRFRSDTGWRRTQSLKAVSLRWNSTAFIWLMSTRLTPNVI